MTLTKRTRERLEGLAEDLTDSAATLADALASWDEVDRDEREDLTSEIAETLGNIAGTLETATELLAKVEES